MSFTILSKCCKILYILDIKKFFLNIWMRLSVGKTKRVAEYLRTVNSTIYLTVKLR